MNKPILIERFADNGEHSHWDLQDADTGTRLWSGGVLASSQGIKARVLEEYKKGNIVTATHEGLAVAPLQAVLEQPLDGLLYDLNRNEATILTFLDDLKWVNDYALVQVLREMDRQLDQYRDNVKPTR